MKYGLRLFVPAIFFLPAPLAVSQDFTPSRNLAGITKVHENISVALNLKGADEFRVDSQKITAALRDALGSVGIGTNGSGVGTPMVGVSISGESTGGGGARFFLGLSFRPKALLHRIMQMHGEPSPLFCGDEYLLFV